MSEVINIKELNERIERESVFVDTLRNEMGKVIVGQSHLVDTLLIGLLSNGHILLEGVPSKATSAFTSCMSSPCSAIFCWQTSKARFSFARFSCIVFSS